KCAARTQHGKAWHQKRSRSKSYACSCSEWSSRISSLSSLLGQEAQHRNVDTASRNACGSRCPRSDGPDMLEVVPTTVYFSVGSPACEALLDRNRKSTVRVTRACRNPAHMAL